MNQTIRFCILGLIIGLSGALLYPSLKGQFSAAPAALTPQPELSVPEGGVVSDTFSLQLFHAALEEQSRHGSVVVTPYALTAWLEQLHLISPAAQQQEDTPAPGTSENSFHSAVGVETLLAADDSLHFTEGDAPVLRVPFRRDYPLASAVISAIINDQLGEYMNSPVDWVSQETRLAGAYSTVMQAPWLRPFNSADCKTDDFNNADGGMPRVEMMRCRNAFRVAEAEDGSWRAVALFMAPQKGDAAEPLALTVILPRGNARDFAAKLTPEQLSAIRTALVQAPLADVSVAMPQLHIYPVGTEMKSLLQQLGFTAPFDIRQADFSPLFSDKIAMNTVQQYVSLHVAAADTQAPKDSGIDEESRTAFRADRPFLWILGDLTTPAPPYAIGLVENL